MFYVHRNEDGYIQSLSQSADKLHQESIAADNPELIAFLNHNNVPHKALQGLSSTDTSFIRVLEDVIDILVERDVLQFTDLPVPAQQKLMARRELRSRLTSELSTSSTLLGDDDSEGLI